MRTLSTFAALGLSLALTACGGGAAERRKDEAMVADWERRADEQKTRGYQAPAANATAEAPAPAPARVRTGTLARGTLHAWLARGLGAFLQHVEVTASLREGRFVGFRVARFFEGDADMRSVDLLPGDVVTAVNALPIERPEQALKVWEALKTASALTVSVRRGDEAFMLEYAIVAP